MPVLKAGKAHLRGQAPPITQARRPDQAADGIGRIEAHLFKPNEEVLTLSQGLVGQGFIDDEVLRIAAQHAAAARKIGRNSG